MKRWCCRQFWRESTGPTILVARCCPSGYLQELRLWRCSSGFRSLPRTICGLRLHGWVGIFTQPKASTVSQRQRQNQSHKPYGAKWLHSRQKTQATGEWPAERFRAVRILPASIATGQPSRIPDATRLCATSIWRMSRSCLPITPLLKPKQSSSLCSGSTPAGFRTAGTYMAAAGKGMACHVNPPSSYFHIADSKRSEP